MKTAILLIVTAIALAGSPLDARESANVSGESEPRLFAVEFTLGPNWDQDKRPHEQRHFSDHSANLQKLRREGTLVVGARYADVGLVVVSAPSQDSARALFDADPTIPAGVFEVRISELQTFYGGELPARH